MTEEDAMQVAGDMERLARLMSYLSDDPDNDALRQEIFDLALSCGRWEAAGDQIRWASIRDVANAPWRHRHALLELAQAQWAAAETLLRGLIDEGHSAPAIVFNLAVAQFHQERFDAAIERLRALLDPWEPRFRDALQLTLRCMHHLHLLDQAIVLLERFGSDDIGAGSLGVGSLIALDLGDMTRVERLAKQALALDAAQHEALVALGSLCVARRQAAGALDHLQRAAQMHPTDGRTLSALGMAQMLTEHLGAARDTFREAANRMPTHIGTWHGLAWACLLQRDVKGARDAFERALLLNRGFGESHGGLAVVQALAGESEEARLSLERALRLDPLSLSARYAEAVLNGETSDPERFTRLARRVLGARRDVEGRALADMVLAVPSPPSGRTA
jgi:tetratricopeptide (TPR) repeat protein